MFKTERVPMVGIEAVMGVVERIDEVWTELSDDAPESLRSMQRDLFELLGITQGLMMALDVHMVIGRRAAKPEDEA
jgi:hypothetical protein